MIVDLMRNDIARIARTGTVRVPALLIVERYATVLQLTSDVTAQLRPEPGWRSCSRRCLRAAR
jgi:para-aminobenzoate synthetase / 4-amino-4-deoxychorismate lyase